MESYIKMEENGQIFFLNDYVLVNNKLIPKHSVPEVNFTDPELVNSESYGNAQNLKDCNTHYPEEEDGDGENIVNYINQENEQENQFTWDRKAVLLLLDEYHERLGQFRNPKVKRKLLWTEIAQAMKEYNYTIPINSLDRKMRNLKSTFLKIKDNNKKSKTGRGKLNWEYYNKMENIFVEDKTVNISSCVSSTPEEILNVESDETIAETSRNNDCATPLSTSSADMTPSNSRKQQKKLDGYRKRQLEIEEERLEELKKIRREIEEGNRINQTKVNLLKDYLESIKK